MWCNKCNIPLSFRNIINESSRGLASNFTITCYKCSIDYNIHTCSIVKNLYDLNYKVAYGKQDLGVFIICVM